jgi:MFS family permease
MEDNPAYKALDQIGWGKYNLRVFLICGSVILIKALVVYESMFVGMAYILQGVQEEWGVSPVFLGIIASLYHVGMLFGNLTWGFLSDKKGRKFPFRMSSILALVSIILICSSVHPYMMCASILLLGYSLSGEMSLSATVFCEFCPPSRRHLLALLYFNISVGAILVSVIALVVVLLNHTPFYDWRIICVAILVLIVFNTILRFFIEESPPFLFRNKNFEQAEAILNQVSMTNKKEEFDFNDTNSVLDPTSQQGKESVYSSLITEIEENPPISVLFKRIFSRRLLPTTLKLSFVKFTQAMNLAILAFASFINFMPELLGFMSTSDSYFVMMIQQAVGIPGAWLGAQLVKTKMGRKWTTSAGFLGAGLFDLLFMLRQEFYFVANI